MKERSLRIAMLSVHSCPVGQPGSRDTGGMNVYIRELAAALGRQGHRVDIFTRAHDPRDAAVELLAPGVRLVHLRAGAVEEMGKLTQYNHLAEFEANLESFIAGTHYDLIHSHYWLSGEVGRRLAARLGIPHVFAFHTVGAAKDELGLGEAEPALRLLTEAEISAACHRVLCGTEKEELTVRRHHPGAADRIVISPCGVNPVLFRPMDRTGSRRILGLPERPLVLYVGRLDKLKGIDRLVTALGLMQNNSAGLLVVGGDDYSRATQERLRAQASAEGVADRVVFHDAAPQSRLPYYYAAADVVAVPSYSETFGMVALEALSCGRPVVSTDVGAARDIIKEGISGTVTAGNVPEMMAAALDGWLDQPAPPAEELQQSVAAFRWDAVAARVTAVYLSVATEEEMEVCTNG
ncbi:glycosyl transferase group 1 [Dehalogenimonas lykanthroporepellens BL-DC-9]|jgi:D-inositol-3-phosphate glycosyltransferase|nr:glycosyl transferase group 1 [Dehalogenimonas lykanthroporepellens BL-DC-9]